MEQQNYEIIISTCEKFSDLWDANVLLLNQNWPTRNAQTYLVTDAETHREFPGIQVISAGEGKEITDRLAVALEYVHTKYVIFTLDDYFFTQPINQEKIDDAICFMEENSVDYLQLYPQPRGFLKRDGARESKKNPGIFFVDLSEGNYKVVLTPGIWRADFMGKTLNGSMNAWQYEVSLTGTARGLNAVCATSNCGELPYLDVIRKGKLLRKASRYFRKNPIYQSKRNVVKWKDELMLNVQTILKFWASKRVLRALKKLMIRCGYTFYSPV